MAVLLATLMTFGRLSEDNEINAMRASGIGFLTIMRAPILFGIIITTILIYFNNFILPEMNFKARLLSGDIYRKRPDMSIEPGIFLDNLPDYSIIVGGKANDGTMKDVRIFSKGNKNAQTISKEKQSRIRNSNAIKIVTSRSDENLYKAALLYLRDEKISLQHANINDNELEVIFAQLKYRNPVIASGRALNILDQNAPNNITSFKVSEINGGMGVYSVAINRNTFII